ncbi:ATP-binding protein, partial [Aneurinibacillus migulanus]
MMEKKMETVNFDVHASLLFQLGEQLIADEITAVSELVKNSYDADARFVKIEVDPDYIKNWTLVKN